MIRVYAFVLLAGLSRAFERPRKPLWHPPGLDVATDAVVHMDSSASSPHPYAAGRLVPVVEEMRVEARLRSNPFDRVVCMLDGGLFVKDADCGRPTSPNTAASCACSWDTGSVGRGYHAVAVYGIRSTPKPSEPHSETPAPRYASRASVVALGNATSIVFLDVPVEKATPWKSVFRSTSAAPRVGVYFTTISDAGQSYWRNFSEAQGVRAAPTVEDALRLSTPFQELARDAALSPAALFPINHTDWPQATPAVPDQSVSPFYCFYRPRDGEVPILPACPNITYHASRQAALLSMAGIDFVLQDASNYGPWDPSLPHGGDPVGDFRQMRPFEVLAEEWLTLRQAGQTTPQLGVFNRISATTNDTMWKVYLHGFYGNQTFDDLVLKLPDREGSPKKVFSVVSRDDINTTAEALIQSDGGKNDMVTPHQWLSHDVNGSDTSRGLWTYFQPCLARPEGSNATVFTSTVWPGGPECGHAMTRNSSAGSVWTVSMAQVMGSMPFANPGKLRGAFFKMQMADVFRSNGQGDVLYSPSWNENAITPVFMTQWSMTNPYFVAAGSSEGDDYRRSLWMDGFGVDRSRFFEPMEQDGGLYYGLYASCVRVLRLSRALSQDLSDPVLPCSVAGEECCQYSAEEVVHPVWSVEHPSTGDSALVATQADLDLFRSRGYTEVCNPYGLPGVNGGPTVFCTDGQQPWCVEGVNGTDVCFRAARGPIMLQSHSGPDFDQPVYRCAGTDGFHWLSASQGCGSTGGNSTLLGYAWSRGGSAAPRRMRGCAGQPTVKRFVESTAGYHALDNKCIDGSDGTALGWVL